MTPAAISGIKVLRYCRAACWDEKQHSTISRTRKIKVQLAAGQQHAAGAEGMHSAFD
jgi:hypothetical protein